MHIALLCYDDCTIYDYCDEDQALKQEISEEAGAFDELKFSREQGFFDRNRGVHLLICLFFFFSLFAILHFREVRVEVLELSSVAPRYIVAQVDFDFFDEEATAIRKSEATKDLGKVYLISDSDIRQQRNELESSLMSDENGKKTPLDSSSVYSAIDLIVKKLHKTRFTDPRTLQRMRDLEMDVTGYEIFHPTNTEHPLRLPQMIWNSIKKSATENDGVTAQSASFVVDFLSEKPWSLEEDIPSERSLRKKVQAKVPEVYSHISGGSRIIDQGEKVTARHIAMLQAMKTALNEERNLWHPFTLLGSFILTSVLAVLCYFHLKINHPQIMNSNRKFFLVVTLCVMTMLLAKLTELILLSSKSNFIDVFRYPLFVPFAALLLCSLVNTQIATFLSGFLAVILTVSLAFDQQGFLLLNITAAIAVILCVRTLQRRKELFAVCAKAWLVCTLIIVALQLYHGSLWTMGVATDILCAGLFMLLTAVIVVGILPLLEAAFGIVTDVTLMEYMDPNNDLLRRLSIEAPGTYQHSIVVGNLAEAAALAIDANGLFCRVATLYHDVGKMATPQYFTENQHGGMNIHQLLTPLESAQVIMAHVIEGVSLARKAGLPEQFIDIIKEHHGTTLVYYFYRKQLEKMGDDINKVEEDDFRYAGPKPRSKESAIIMIADSLEAASRSLDVIDEKTVTELANQLIKHKTEDGQFDHCLLTYEEMAVVKETLVKTLVAFSHARVKYPNRKEAGPEKEKDTVPSSVA